MTEVTQLAIDRGASAYLTYCNGVWIAQEPEKSFELLGERDLESSEGIEEIVFCIKSLLRDGARDFIQASFPEDVTAFQDARNDTASVEQRARRILSIVADNEKERLMDMNPAFWRLKPAPFLESGLLTKLMHSTYDGIKINQMLGYFAPHSLLREQLKVKTLLLVRSEILRLKGRKRIKIFFV